jgi:excinuclease ABC subunit C
MLAAPETIAAKLPHLPESPGVYLWKDADGVVLYVGKAKRLRSRVRSYLASDHLDSVKTRALMQQSADLDTIVVPTEAHALILEANLIKEYRPRFNIALRDDKSYPYIKVTVQEPFPRVFVTRRLIDDDARYFGPYTDVGQMRRALNVVKRIFTVRSCNYDMPREMPERACLDYHIGRCKAPCILAQSQDDYRAMIDEVLLFLDGRADEVIRRVRDRMETAAVSLDFERAAELRDALRHLERMEEPTIVLEVEGGDRDVVGYARDGDDACVAILRIRRGKLLARDHRFVENIADEDDAAVLSAYLARTYVSSDERAAELLVPFDFEDREAMEISVAGTRVIAPQRGPRRELVDLAQQNARHLLEELKLSTLESDERATSPVYELGRELGLQRLPRSLVCFDISTAQGTDTVGSCVWFENGRPRRAEYRKFKVKSVEGTDDFASMREVVGRYFRRRLDEHKPMPDLVVIDGGKGQLGAAADAIRELGLDTLRLVSLAKREEEIYVLGRSDPIRLSRRSPGLRMLQQARDEAHRFAVTYNRKRRSLRTVTSELLSIPGIGPSKRRLLLQTFGSVQGVRNASAEQIAALPGFSDASARQLLAVLAARAEGQTMHRPSSAGASAEATPNVIAPGAISGLENAPDPVGPDAGAAGPIDSQFHSDSQPSDHP